MGNRSLPFFSVAPRPPDWLARVGALALWGAAYLAATRLRIVLADPSTQLTPVWPALGLNLAVLLRFGWRRNWIPLAMFALIQGLLHRGHPLSALGVAAGNTLGPLLAAWAVERFAGGARFLETPSTVFRFAIHGAAVSGTVGASLGVLGGLLAGKITGAGAASLWFGWFAADFIGALLITPLLLAWSTRTAPDRQPPARWLEGVALAVTCVVGAQFAFRGWPFFAHRHPVEYLSIPILLWAAFRFSSRGATTITATLAALAIANTFAGDGPFADPAQSQPGESLIYLQLFLGCVSLMTLATAAVVGERRAHAASLENTVARRTGEIAASNDQLRVELAERRRAEEALRESREMLRLVINVIPQAVFWKDRASVFLGCNRRFLQASGLASPEEIVGKTDYDLPWTREQSDAYRAADRQVMESGEPINHIAERLLQADGSEQWLETNKLPLRDPAGRVVGVLCTFEDVTERRRIEQALQAAHDELELRVEERTAELARAHAAVGESEHRLRLALEAGRMSVWQIDARTDDLAWNSSRRSSGWTPGTLPETFNSFTRDVHPEDLPAALAHMDRCKAEGRPFVLQYRYIRHRDHSERWLETRGQPLFNADGRPTVITGVSMDITASKVAEAALRESEHRLRLALEAGRMSVWQIDPKTSRVEWTRVQRDSGWAEDAFPESLEAFTAKVHPEDRAATLEGLERCKTEHLPFLLQYRFVRESDHRVRWIESLGRAVLDRAGRLTAIIGLSMDITKRKAAEDALRASEGNYRSLFELNPEPTWVYDLSTLAFMAVNQAAVERYGYSREEFLAMTIADLHPAEDEARLRDYIATRPPTFSKAGIWRHRKKDGTLIEVEIASDQLLFAGRPARLVVAADVTERKAQEMHLQTHACQQAAVARFGQRALELGESSLENLLTEAADLVAEVLGADFTTVFEHLPEQGVLIRRAGHGWPADALNRVDTGAVASRETASGYTFVTGQPVISADMARETRFKMSPYAQRHGAVAVTDVIIARAASESGPAPAPFGVLSALFRQPRVFSGEEVVFMQAVANTLATVIAHQRAEHQLAERARQQAAVARLGQRALELGESALDELLTEAVNLVAETLGADFSTVLEHQIEQGLLIRRAGYGWPPESIGKIQGSALDGLNSVVGYTLMTGQAVVREDMRQESAFHLAQHSIQAGVIAIANVIIAREAGGSTPAPAPFGVLNALFRRRRAFSQEDVAFLQAVANTLAAAIARQRAEAAIHQAREEAERANAAKSEFLSRMSHELRTPLNAILGFGQLLEIAELDAPHEQSVGYILRAGRHLLGLIDEVLDIARIESGHLTLSPESIPTAPLLAEVVSLLRPMAEDRSVRLPGSHGLPDTHVLADRQRLKQVLLNLLSNAIKYNRDGGEVTITCQPASSPADSVRLEVRDTGHGMTAAELERLFVPFERLGAERHGIEGTGIGLAISKRLAESMDGRITVASTPGVGSVFTVELPRATPADENDENAAGGQLDAVGADADADPAEAERTVLYIEDNLPNLRLIEHIFARRPTGRRLRLISAIQGGLGLDLARQHRPDLILLDLQLPDLSGEEVLERLRADPQTREIPVIVLSADATARQAEKLLAAGAVGYVTKPLDLSSFLTLLNRTLEPPLTLPAL